MISITSTFYTAVLFSLYSVASHSEYVPLLVPVFMNLAKTTPPTKRSFIRIIKNVLLCFFRYYYSLCKQENWFKRDQNATQYYKEIQDVLLSDLSAKSWEIQVASRRREHEQNLKKRANQASEAAPDNKRRRMEQMDDERAVKEEFDVADYILTTIDVTKFPVETVTSIVLEVLQSCTAQAWQECIKVCII